MVFHNNEFEISFVPDGAVSFRVYAPLLSKQLGYRETKDMVRVLDDDEKMQVSGGGKNSGASHLGVWYVTEPGFYKIVGQRNINVIRDPKIRAAVHVLPGLVADLVGTMREIGEPQAQQYQLQIFSADDLKVIEGGAS